RAGILRVKTGHSTAESGFVGKIHNDTPAGGAEAHVEACATWRIGRTGSPATQGRDSGVRREAEEGGEKQTRRAVGPPCLGCLAWARGRADASLRRSRCCRRRRGRPGSP